MRSGRRLGMAADIGAMLVMTVVVMTVVVMTMVVSVVVAARGRGLEPPIEEGGDEFLHPGPGDAGANGDSLAAEEVQGAMADAFGDDVVYPVLPQPAGEDAGLVVRGREEFGPENRAGFRIHLDEGELAGAAEVAVQAAVVGGDGKGQAANGLSGWGGKVGVGSGSGGVGDHGSCGVGAGNGVRVARWAPVPAAGQTEVPPAERWRAGGIRCARMDSTIVTLRGGAGSVPNHAVSRIQGFGAAQAGHPSCDAAVDRTPGHRKMRHPWIVAMAKRPADTGSRAGAERGWPSRPARPVTPEWGRAERGFPVVPRGSRSVRRDCGGGRSPRLPGGRGVWLPGADGSGSPAPRPRGCRVAGATD